MRKKPRFFVIGQIECWLRKRRRLRKNQYGIEQKKKEIKKKKTSVFLSLYGRLLIQNKYTYFSFPFD